MTDEALKAAETKLLDFVVKHKHITTTYQGYQIDITAKKSTYANTLTELMGEE